MLIYDGFFFKAWPFVYVDESIDPNALYEFMISEWKLNPANIIIPVLSCITNHKPFKNLKMIESLRSGIKNVRYLSVVRRTHILLSCLDIRRI
jgi:hypothetical protein